MIDKGQIGWLWMSLTYQEQGRTAMKYMRGKDFSKREELTQTIGLQ